MAQYELIKNAHLDGDEFYYEGSTKTGLLLLHGFTATTTEVRLLAECLVKTGYTITAPLLPGHGTHPDDLNKVRWQDWVDHAETAYLALKEKVDEVVVGGESMGGLVALMMAARHPEIKGVMTFAPAIKVPLLWLSPVIALFTKWLKKENKDDGLAWKGYLVNPSKGAVQLLKLQKTVKQELPKIRQPLLLVTGGYDRTISPESKEILLEKVGSQKIVSVHMAHSGHCIILDKELPDVCQLARDFISGL